MVEPVVPPGKPIKLVVWDLEDALWGEPLVRTLISTCDERGILQSLVGRGDPEHLLAKLRRHGLAEFFLQPHPGGPPIPEQDRQIAQILNIRLDSVLLISGETLGPANPHPQIRALEPGALASLADDPLMGKRLAALEVRPRRLVYLEEQIRKQSERDFQGSRQEFLDSLEMRLVVEPARLADLHRVEELFNRPNQLCMTYSEQELRHLLSSPRHACWLVSLRDRCGDCGQVGTVLLERSADCWTLQLLLFSCRATPRCVDAIVLNALLRKAQQAGVSLRALFRRSSRNEALLSAYQRAGFAESDRLGDLIVLTHQLARIGPDPCQAQLMFAGV